MREEVINVLRGAWEKAPFYREKYKEVDFDNGNFTEVPILTKHELREFAEQLLCDEWIGAKRKELRVERTSGSTGKFTTVYWCREDYNKSNMHLWRLRNRWYGIYPNSKLVTFNSLIFAGTRLLKPKRITFLDNQRSLLLSKFNLLDDDLHEYIDVMNRFKPDWMMVQNSVLARLCDFMQRKHLALPTSIKYIELNGEATSKETKQYYRNCFGVPIADMYGATEVNGIAYECPCGRAHVLEKNVYLETVEREEGPMAIVTSLCNMAMPIIRYELGDIVELGESEQCECGMVSTYIKQVKGRVSDKIDTSDGRHVSPYVFLFCIEKTNEMLFHPIVQFKILQRQVDSIVIRIKIKEEQKGWTKTIENELVRMVYEQNTGIDVTVEVTECSLEMNSEKFKFFERIYD